MFAVLRGRASGSCKAPRNSWDSKAEVPPTWPRRTHQAQALVFHPTALGHRNTLIFLHFLGDWGGGGFLICHQLAFRSPFLLGNLPPLPHSGFSRANMGPCLWAHFLPPACMSFHQKVWDTAWWRTCNAFHRHSSSPQPNDIFSVFFSSNDST